LVVTDDAVPVVQRFVVGAVVKDCPLEEPQVPFTGGCVGGVMPIVTLFVADPPAPVQVMVYVVVPVRGSVTKEPDVPLCPVVKIQEDAYCVFQLTVEVPVSWTAEGLAVRERMDGTGLVLVPSVYSSCTRWLSIGRVAWSMSPVRERALSDWNFFTAALVGPP
jgi:hypothetical protein